MSNHGGPLPLAISFDIRPAIDRRKIPAANGL